MMLFLPFKKKKKKKYDALLPVCIVVFYWFIGFDFFSLIEFTITDKKKKKTSYNCFPSSFFLISFH